MCVLPRSANACLITLVESLKAFQEDNLPLPANVPVTSAPENAWNPGRACPVALPKESCNGLIILCLLPVPVTNAVSFGNSWKRLRVLKHP